MACVYARMAEGLTAVAAAHPGEAVAVASHGCAIRNALCWARGWPIERLGEVPWADDTRRGPAGVGRKAGPGLSLKTTVPIWRKNLLRWRPPPGGENRKGAGGCAF